MEIPTKPNQPGPSEPAMDTQEKKLVCEPKPTPMWQGVGVLAAMKEIRVDNSQDDVGGVPGPTRSI